MKKLNPKNAIIALILCAACFLANPLIAQNDIFNSNGGKMDMKSPTEASSVSLSRVLIPWSKGDLMSPDLLATNIKNGKIGNTLIFNVGSVNDIKGAVNIGPVAVDANLEKLKNYLVKVPKSRSIVIYCGCCPVNVCPNIKPAYNLLKKEGYSNFKVLNLKDNLNMDWISKKYPMKK